MGPMDPLPVWKVELAQGLVDHDVRGELTLTDTHVVFMPADSEIGATIEYAAILQVKRLKLSPVLLVRWVDEGERRETAYLRGQAPTDGEVARRRRGRGRAGTPGSSPRGGCSNAATAPTSRRRAP